MNLFIPDSMFDFIAYALIILGIAGLFVSARLRARTWRMPQLPWRAHLLESTVLIILFAAVCMVPWIRLPWNPPDMISERSLGLLITSLGILPLLIPVLFVRFVRSRFIAVLFSTAWVMLVFYSFYWIFEVPKFKDILGQDEMNLLADKWLFPFGLWFARISAWAVLLFAGAVFAVRKNFRWWKFVAGSLAAGYLASFLLMPFCTSKGAWVFPLTLTALGTAIILLPLQRAALERQFGVALSRNSSPEPALHALAGSRLGYGVVGLIVLFVALSAFVNYFERLQFALLESGPSPAWRAPGLRNAADEMSLPNDSRLSWREKQSTSTVSRLLSRELPEFDWRHPEDETTGPGRRVWQEIDTSTLHRAIETVAPSLNALERASKADYLEFPGTRMPSYMNMIDEAKAMRLRACLALREDRTTDALRDMRALFNFAALFRNQPLMLSQEVGFHLRRTAVQSARDYLGTMTNHQAALQDLSDMLQETVTSARAMIDVDPLRRGEPALAMPVIPNADLFAYSLLHDRGFRLATLGGVDMVRIGTALELYRLQNESYPQRLQELLPGYLDRLPLDPVQGKEYTNVRVPDGRYKLTCEALEQLREEYKYYRPGGDLGWEPPVLPAVWSAIPLTTGTLTFRPEPREDDQS